MEAWPFNSKVTVSHTEVNRAVSGMPTGEEDSKLSSRLHSLPISNNRRTLKLKLPQVMEPHQLLTHPLKCKCLHTVSRFLLLSTDMDSYKHQSCPSGSRPLHPMVKSIITTNAQELRSGRSQQVCCKELACVVLSSEHLFLFPIEILLKSCMRRCSLREDFSLLCIILLADSVSKAACAFYQNAWCLLSCFANIYVMYAVYSPYSFLVVLNVLLKLRYLDGYNNVEVIVNGVWYRERNIEDISRYL